MIKNSINLTAKELVELTNKRIESLTEVELKFSFDCSDNYPLMMKELLDAIHSGEDKRIGTALKMFLYAFNQADIQLHGGL